MILTQLQAHVLEKWRYVLIILRAHLVELGTYRLRVGHALLCKYFYIITINFVSNDEFGDLGLGCRLVALKILGPFFNFFKTQFACYVINDQRRLCVVEIEFS